MPKGDYKAKLGFNACSPRMKALDSAMKCRQLGLGSIQLSGDFPINFPENINKSARREFNEYIKANDIRLHYHAPSDIPLASRHDRLRRGGLQRLAEYIELAIDMGAKSFVFHPGRFAFYKIGSGKIIMANRNIPEIYFERFYDSVSKLADSADGHLELLLENTYGFAAVFINVVDRFLALPRTGLVWDIGHMQGRNIINTQNQAEIARTADFFSERLDFIKLAHLHDAAQNRSHLPLGKGTLDIAAHFDILSRLNIEMIIEVFSEKDLKISLEYLESLQIKRLS